MMKPAMRRRGRTIALAAGAGVLAVAVIALINRDKLAAHYRFWRLFESIGRNEEGYPEYRHRRTGIVMVRVPGGTFVMGTPEEEGSQVIAETVRRWGSKMEARAKAIVKAEQPRHRVSLSPFLIAKYEVTQAVWRKTLGTDHPTRFTGDDLPVDSLSREDCLAFCNKTGMALPTEAQWEYACRAGTATAYSGQRVDDLGWHQNNCGFKMNPVGQKAPNDFGLFDMHGNAAEYVLDSWEAEFYSREEASGPDPICTGGDRSIYRGGNWNDPEMSLRSAHRHQGAAFSVREIFAGCRPAYYPVP